MHLELVWLEVMAIFEPFQAAAARAALSVS
jgi:hypothetical protein